MRKQTVKKEKYNVHDYPGLRQPVVAVRPDGKTVGFFDSIKIAVDMLGVSRDGITNCCRGRQRLCGGLNWFYEKDFKAIFFAKDTEALKTQDSESRNDDGTFKKGHHFNRGLKRKVDKERCRANMRRQREKVVRGSTWWERIDRVWTIIASLAFGVMAWLFLCRLKKAVKK